MVTDLESKFLLPTRFFYFYESFDFVLMKMIENVKIPRFYCRTKISRFERWKKNGNCREAYVDNERALIIVVVSFVFVISCQ